MITQWLRRWTWNPMGTSRARSSPARSLWSHFLKYIQKKLGTRTKIYVRKQLRLITRTKDSQLLFLERTCRRHRLETTTTTTLSKKSKTSTSKNLSEDGIGFHQNKIYVNIAMITQWLRRWTWNPMGTSRARPSPARSLWSHFQKYNQKKLGTRTNTCVRKQLRLTKQRFSVTFPGKDM